MNVERESRTANHFLFLVFFGVMILSLVGRADDSTNKTTVIVVVGAPGEDDFEKRFVRSAELWTKASTEGGARPFTIGLNSTNEISDRENLKNLLSDEPKESEGELWLVLLGHGTFDGREAKFNLRGPDVSASDLADWLKPFRRQLIIVNCASASSPFLNKLSGPDRVIITATRSGYEQNYARFGEYLSAAITDAAADLDKDGQTSLLEAFIMGSRQTGEFYESEGRLATEHALLDDNGDGLGTAADFFRGVRAVKKSEGGLVDGLRAHQIHLLRSPDEQRLPSELRARRDELEQAIARLRESKIQLGDEEYYRRLENLLIELAKLYEKPS